MGSTGILSFQYQESATFHSRAQQGTKEDPHSLN